MDVDEIQKVEGIDTKEVFDEPKRLELITNHIIHNFSKKTYNREYSSIFAVSSIPNLLKYYDFFKQKDHNLKIATIFSYGTNEDLCDDGIFEVEMTLKTNSPWASNHAEYGVSDKHKHSREKLDQIVQDFNKTYGTNHDLNRTGGFQAYLSIYPKKSKRRRSIYF